MQDTKQDAGPAGQDWTDPLAPPASAEPVDESAKLQVDESGETQDQPDLGDTTGDPLATVRARVAELKIVEGFKIGAPAEAIEANTTLQEIKALEKRVAAAKKAELEPIKKQESDVREKYRPAENLLDHAEAVVKGALQRFQREEAFRIEEDNRRAAAVAAAAKRKAEEEAAEIQRKAEEKAAALRAQGKEAKAEDVVAHAQEKAESKIAGAEMLPAAMQTGAPTKLRGFSTSVRWTGEVSDPRVFLTWLISQPGVDLPSIVGFKAAGLDILAKIYKRNAAIPGFIANPVMTSQSRARPR